jgi:hypothetical protein
MDPDKDGDINNASKRKQVNKKYECSLPPGCISVYMAKGTRTQGETLEHVNEVKYKMLTLLTQWPIHALRV